MRALRGRAALLLALVAAAVLAFLVTAQLYPVSMIGVAGTGVQNTSPPTIALMTFASVQSELLLAAAPALTRWLCRSRWRPAVATADRNVMDLYLWHMVPVIAVAVIAYPAGLMPQPARGSSAWWLFRVVWVVVLSIVTAAGLALMWWGRIVFARGLPRFVVRLPATFAVPLMFIGVALIVHTMRRFAADGFAPDGSFPVATALQYTAGVTLSILMPNGLKQCRSAPTKTRNPVSPDRIAIGRDLWPWQVVTFTA